MKTIKNHFYIVAIMLCFLLGCEKETLCPTAYEMDSFELLPSSKNLFPYKDSIVHMIFRDSLNNEIAAVATKSSYGFGKTHTTRACVHQPELDINLSANTEYIGHFVSIPAIDIGFNVNFRTSPNFADYELNQVMDVAFIIFSDSAAIGIPSIFPPQLFLVVDQRNHPVHNSNPVVPITNFDLLGREFTDVYTNKTGSDKVTFHYNHDIGIVGFKLHADATYWVFDRFE